MFIHWCIANIKEQYLICAGHNGIKLEVILKSWKIHKSVEIKQTAHEQPTGQRRNQERERKKNLEANKNKNTVDQMYVMLYKQFQEGSL